MVGTYKEVIEKSPLSAIIVNAQWLRNVEWFLFGGVVVERGGGWWFGGVVLSMYRFVYPFWEYRRNLCVCVCLCQIMKGCIALKMNFGEGPTL